jgi:hypothetical protein
MAFAETRSANRVVQGILPMKVTLAGDVEAGDCLGYDSGWKLSASATTIQPILIAGATAVSGAVIDAYPFAVVTVVTTSANTATAGEIVALNDSGEYVAASGGYPDVGVVAGRGSLWADIIVCPSGLILAMNTARS